MFAVTSVPYNREIMSYAAALENLGTLIPELLGVPGMPRRKFSLHEIGQLCAALDHPQRRFPSVLIAGTNGKGSTSSTLASIAREAGLTVGLYTSPHLDRVNERIQLGTPHSRIAEIADEDFARHYFRVHDAAQQLVLTGAIPALPSYFELLTALAFVYFAASGVDLAVLEVGMGGRLDATNIVDPILSVVTDISLDHQEWLGDTIAAIAREKAGILRASGTLVTLPQHPEANQALGEVAESLAVRGVNAAQYMPPMGTNPMSSYPVEVLGREIRVDSPLKGAHQHRNLSLAIAAAVELATAHSLPITPEDIERGIRATRWPARLECLQFPGQPEYILDVAHNPGGAWALRAALSAQSAAPVEPTHQQPGRPDLPTQHPQVLIFACLRDKPLREMAQILFPLFDHVVLAPIHSPRANDMADLMAAAEATGVPASASTTVAEALEIARRVLPAHRPAEGRIVISGSVYLVGEARHLLLQPAEVRGA
jgi:dihydrofolate synthase/folylpolyglutamate synthase